MRKAIIITCLTLSGLIILDSLDVAHAIMMFLLAGVIPGTNYAISATDMIFIFSLLTGFVVARVMSRAMFAIRSRRLTQQQA